VDLLVEYLQKLHDTGAPLWRGVHTILGVQTHFRRLKGRLRGAWDSIVTWRLQEPVRSRVPIPHGIMHALRAFGVLCAVKLEPHLAAEWWSFAVCVQVLFFGLLRPKELWGLQACHVKLPGPRSFMGTNAAVLTIVSPKNKAFMGRLQVRVIRDAPCIAWLDWSLSGAYPADRVWPFSEYIFRSMLKRACTTLGLAKRGLTAASFRAGGATWLLETGVAVGQIRFMGSWASDRSLASYLQEAEACAALLGIPPAAARRLEHLLEAFAATSRPPALSFGAVLRQQWRQKSTAR